MLAKHFKLSIHESRSHIYKALNSIYSKSIHESCSRFYKALNGIYSKSKRNMNEMVTFQLIIAYCKPLLTYHCECVKLNRSVLSQLDRAWNSVFWEIFEIYYKDCITDIQISVRQLPISMGTRKIKYISKLRLSKNKILAGLFNISGYLINQTVVRL